MKKKNKHTAPMQYRIIYRAGNSLMKSKQYYNVFHSSEALEDIYHTFHNGKIHSNKITIYKIQERERFTDKWIDRLEAAVKNFDHHKHDHDELVSTRSHMNQSNKIILERKKQ